MAYQDYGLSLVNGPAEEPLTLAEVKQHLRVEPDANDEDALYRAWVTMGRQFAESYTGCKFGAQTWQLTLDEFPSDPIRLPGAKSITHVKYLDADSELQTLDASTYTLRADKAPTLLHLALNASWPATDGSPGCVRVTFVCGETPDELVKSAIRLIVGWHDKNRESDALPNGSPADYSPAILRLLDQKRTGLLYGVA